MKIKNHLLNGVDYQPSPNVGGKITPKFIVQHYTAGYTASSAINTLTNRNAKVSAHVVVDLDGTITQLVPFNVKAWHAGASSHMGYSGLNNHSIGIEIVNIGWMRKLTNNNYQDAYNNIKSESDFPSGLVAAENPRVGSGTLYWPRYTEAQIKVVDELTALLVAEYKILDIVSHEEIDTRGWKTDPGPAFPMKFIKRHLGDRGQDSEQFKVTASSLNVRGGPGTNFNTIASLKKGELVEILERNGDWGRINDDGWIHTGYIQRV